MLSRTRNEKRRSSQQRRLPSSDGTRSKEEDEGATPFEWAVCYGPGPDAGMEFGTLLGATGETREPRESRLGQVDDEGWSGRQQSQACGASMTGSRASGRASHAANCKLLSPALRWFRRCSLVLAWRGLVAVEDGQNRTEQRGGHCAGLEKAGRVVPSTC